MDDFHQAAYYMNDRISKFVVLAFRGIERKKHYYEHIRRIAEDKSGIVLLLTQKDLEVFVRRAIIGKSNECHLQEQYDQIVREIS